MKRLLTLLAIFFLLAISGYGIWKYTSSSPLDSNQIKTEEKTAQHIKIEDGKVFFENKELLNADAETFTATEYGYKDKDSVWFDVVGVQARVEIDPEKFRILVKNKGRNSVYYTDGAKVYYGWATPHDHSSYFGVEISPFSFDADIQYENDHFAECGGYGFCNGAYVYFEDHIMAKCRSGFSNTDECLSYVQRKFLEFPKYDLIETSMSSLELVEIIEESFLGPLATDGQFVYTTEFKKGKLKEANPPLVWNGFWLQDRDSIWILDDWDEVMRQDGIDTKKYISFSEKPGFAHDGTYIYYELARFKDADLPTFVVEDGFAKDRKSVWLFRGEVLKILEADPSSFALLKFPFSRDKKYIFYDDAVVLGADPDTFQFLKTQTGEKSCYVRDSDQVWAYFNEERGTLNVGNVIGELKGVDVDSFLVTNYCLAEDKDDYYRDFTLELYKDRSQLKSMGMVR